MIAAPGKQAKILNKSQIVVKIEMASGAGIF